MKEFINKYSKRINIFSFIFALILGISAGIYIGNGIKQEDESIPPISANEIVDLSQSNKLRGLIIGVDDLTGSTSTLESAWWLSYDERNQKFQLMPLYPVLPINAPEKLLTYLAPHNPILFSSPELATIKYHEIFSSYNLNWDFTFMVDQFMLDQMINIYSNLSLDSSILKVDYLNSLSPSLAGKDPTAALAYQRKIIEILCDDPGPLLTETWLTKFFDLSSHFRTDLDFNNILLLRENILNSTIAPSCKFSWQ